MKPVEDRDSLFCDYCGSFHFPAESPEGVRVLDEPSALDCPTCHIPLTSAAIEGSGVLYCTTCRGILANQSLFLALVEYQRAHASSPPDRPRPLNPQDLEREVYCPWCHQLMHTHPCYGPGNVVVDNCAHCRIIWLDYGELGVITNAPGPDHGWSMLVSAA